MEPLPISKTISVKEAGFNEYWLQEQIWENPSCLGLDDLEGISKEKQTSSGGKLDILLKNPVDDSMYEVEVMLGETDASHIIRTIEYWDLVKKKWPQRQHFAVLVAEKITKRFFNVVQLLSNSVPIIAIQANIIDIEGKRSLHFTKILDSYEEPEDDLTGSGEIYDRQYWEKKSIHVLKIAEKIVEITSEIYKGANLVFGKGRISIACDGYNQMALFRRAGNKALIQFRFGHNKEAIETLLDGASISYTEQRKHFKITIGKSDLEEKQETIQKIAELNNRWWE